MGLFGGLFKSTSEKRLRKKQKRIGDRINWRSDKDITRKFKKMDRIDEKLNRRSWKEWKRQNKKKSNKSYGVHREHGWYLPNDD